MVNKKLGFEVSDTLLQQYDENIIASKTDVTGKITYVSKAFCKISGYSQEELLGKSHRIVRDPQMPKKVFKELWDTIIDGKVWKGEVRNRKKDGSFYWVEAIIAPEYNHNGELIGFSAIRHDITAKKEIEKLKEELEIKVQERTIELEQERKFINAIIHSSQDALIVINKDSIITNWNDTASKIFGYSKEEALGSLVDIIIPEHFREPHYNGINRVLNNGEQKLLAKGAIEIQALTKSGELIDVDLSLNSFTINGELFFSANIRDISERKELTDQLHYEKTFIQNLLDSQEQIIITTNGKELVSANKTFFNFFNIKSISEFVTTYNANCICETFSIEKSLEYLQPVMEGKSWTDYVLEQKEQKSFKAKIVQNGTEHIFSVTVAYIDSNKEIKSVVFTDITQIENAKLEVELLHKHTKESIEYASLIQGALVPDNKILRDYFQNYFVIWHPKDIVGGDIYLFEPLSKDECLLMVIDCTGHGVPGAFVTMLVKAIERQIVSQLKIEQSEVSPAKILSFFNKNMKQLLKQEYGETISNAGFDGGIFYYNKKEKIVKFAGAETPLFYVEDNELKVIKGNRYSVGYKKCDINYDYKEHTIEVKEGMQFYITTDGYLDQNGGEKGFPLGKRRFQNIIKEYAVEEMADQQEVFLGELMEYQGEYETNDDITLVGIKI